MVDTNDSSLDRVVVGVYEVKIGKGVYRPMNFFVQRDGTVTKYDLEVGNAIPNGLVAALRRTDPTMLSYDVEGLPSPAPVGTIQARYQPLNAAERELLTTKLGSTDSIDVEDIVEKAKAKGRELYESPAGKSVRAVGRLGARAAARGLKAASEKLAELGEKGKKKQ